jgi:hypothetical protein
MGSYLYRYKRICSIALAAAMTLLLIGCGSGKDVGSEEILDFEEQEAERLGTSPSPEAANPGATQPPPQAPPAAQKPAAPAPEQTFFDVGLIATHPYFEPGDEIIITRGVTLRVTNKDTTAERPDRAFTAEDGTFDSGRLKPGQVWTMKFDSPGTWKIVDRAAPFISAKFEVR